MKKTKGYFTVEAAFIFPVIFITIISIIWLCIYLSNRLKLEADADSIVNMAEKAVLYNYDYNIRDIKYDEKIGRSLFYPIQEATEYEKEKIMAYAKDILQKGYFLGHISKIDLLMDHTLVCLTIEYEMNLPERGLSGSLISPYKTIRCSRIREFSRRDEVVRGITTVIKTGKKIKGISEILNKLK